MVIKGRGIGSASALAPRGNPRRSAPARKMRQRTPDPPCPTRSGAPQHRDSSSCRKGPSALRRQLRKLRAAPGLAAARRRRRHRADRHFHRGPSPAPRRTVRSVSPRDGRNRLQDRRQCHDLARPHDRRRCEGGDWFVCVSDGGRLPHVDAARPLAGDHATPFRTQRSMARLPSGPPRTSGRPTMQSASASRANSPASGNSHPRMRTST